MRKGLGSMTVGEMLRGRATATPNRVAIDFLDRPTTYRELDTRSERLAAALLRAGLRQGDRVATITGTCPEHVEIFFACAKAGLILVPLNWRLAPAELAYQLRDSDAGILFVQPAYESLADEVAKQTSVTPLRVTLEAGALAGFVEGAGDARSVSVADDDPLLIIYTAGTTGKPKGAVLTHANCFWTNVSLDRTIDVTTTDVVLQVVPQFHVGGWNAQPLLAWWKGATLVMEPSFDPGRVLKLIERKRVSTTLMVPAMYLFVAQHPDFASADLSSLRAAGVGGAPMPEPLIRTWQERGILIIQGYGLTEAAPNVLGLPPEDAARKIGCAGKPYLHVHVALRDTSTGALLDGPGRGEVLVKGPNVFAGYWRNPEATARSFWDGWLLTGDVAERDEEGYYRICDRTKDMYISGGENVYPAEVESVLHEHPDIVDAAVIGVANERWGEVGLACVVLRSGASLSEEDIVGHCRERLAKYKVPVHARFLDALPRSAMGKVLKTELRDRYVPDFGSNSGAPRP